MFRTATARRITVTGLIVFALSASLVNVHHALGNPTVWYATATVVGLVVMLIGAVAWVTTAARGAQPRAEVAEERSPARPAPHWATAS